MPTDQKTGRPVVGPADDATRKRMLKEKLEEREPPGLYESKRIGSPAETHSATLNPFINVKQRKGKINQAIADAGG